MTPVDKNKIDGWLTTLREVATIYHGHTIGNIIQQMEARVKYHEQQNSTRQ